MVSKQAMNTLVDNTWLHATSCVGLPVELPSIVTAQVDALAVSRPLKGRTRTATFTDDIVKYSLYFTRQRRSSRCYSLA